MALSDAGILARLVALNRERAAEEARGRTREGIAAHLDLLTDLGMLSRADTPEGPRWRRPDTLGA